MFQLVIVVIAIVLLALVVAGGVSYLNGSLGLRTEFDQALRSQHNTIRSAISSFRVANHGFVPQDIQQLNGFLPKGGLPILPRGMNPVRWEIIDDGSGSRRLCLTRTAEPIKNPVADAIAQFAAFRTKELGAAVHYAAGTCDDAVGSDLAVENLATFLLENPNVSVLFEEI